MDKSQLAKDSQTPPAVLTQLAQDKAWKVRAAVARNPQFPPFDYSKKFPPFNYSKKAEKKGGNLWNSYAR